MINHFKSNSNLLKDCQSIMKFSSVDISETSLKKKDNKQRTRNQLNDLYFNKAVSYDKNLTYSHSTSKNCQKKASSSLNKTKDINKKKKSIDYTRVKYSQKIKKLPTYLNKKINISFLNLEGTLLINYSHNIGCKSDKFNSTLKKDKTKTTVKSNKSNEKKNKKNVVNDSLNLSHNFSFDGKMDKNSRNKTKSSNKSFKSFKSIFVNSYSYFPQSDEPFKHYKNNSLTQKNNININSNNSINNKSTATNTTGIKITSSTANYSKDNSHLVIDIKETKSSKGYQSLTSNITTSNTNFFNSGSFSNITSLSKSLCKQLEEIDLDIDKSMKEIKKTNSKSKKYNSIKHYFEILIKVLSNNSNLIMIKILQKILCNIHEVVADYANENRNIKELNSSLFEKLEEIKKNLLSKDEIIHKCDKEIEILRKKIGVMTSSSEGSAHTNIPISSNDKDMVIECNTNNNEANQEQINQTNIKIMNINKSNLNDLDALYFFDKVDMTINQSSPTQIIPILPLNKTLNIKTSTNKPKVLNEKNIKIK